MTTLFIDISSFDYHAYLNLTYFFFSSILYRNDVTSTYFMVQMLECKFYIMFFCIAGAIDLNSQGPGMFNGDQYILYYADVTIEMAFIIPSSRHPPSPSMSDQFVMELDSKDKNGKRASIRSKLSLDLPAHPMRLGSTSTLVSISVYAWLKSHSYIPGIQKF